MEQGFGGLLKGLPAYNKIRYQKQQQILPIGPGGLAFNDCGDNQQYRSGNDFDNTAAALLFLFMMMVVLMTVLVMMLMPAAFMLMMMLMMMLMTAALVLVMMVMFVYHIAYFF